MTDGNFHALPPGLPTAPAAPAAPASPWLRLTRAWPWLVMLYITQPAMALDPSTLPSQYVLDNWQVTEGLPQNSALAIARTPDGYLWIGTQEGLARFDGVRFTVFDDGSEAGIPDKFVSVLTVDHAGRLWIGTRAGLAVLDKGRFRERTLPPPFEHSFVRSILEDHLGRLWVGTEAGLLEIKPDSVESVTAGDAGEAEAIRALAEDRDGILWVSTASGGLYRLVDRRLDAVPFVAGAVNVTISAMFQEPGGPLWLGTSQGDLYRRTGDRMVAVADHGRIGSGIRTVMRDRDGNVWIGTRGGGLMKWRDGALTPVQSGLFGGADLRALIEDPEGSLWMGSAGSGLFRWRDGKFTPFGEAEGLEGSPAWSITARAKGGLWVGTDAGLSVYESGAFRHIAGPPGHERTRVRAVIEDHRHVVWAGSDGAGLYRFERGTLTTFDRNSGLSGNTVTAIEEDRQGRIWIGTNNGLDRIEQGRITSVRSLIPVPGTVGVNLIHEDRLGRVWIATEAQGLFVFDGRHTLHYGAADGLPSDWVIALLEDERGRTWLGTTGGLALWHDGTITSLAKSAPSFRETTLELLEDDSHRIWMTTNKGLLSVPRAALDALAMGDTHNPPIQLYGASDGMRSAEFAGGNTNPGYRTSDGLLWFPGIRGLVRIDPAHIRSNTLPPPVHIEAVNVDDKPLALTSDIRVPPGNYRWEITYTALSLMAPRLDHFRYRLDGYDKAWIEAGNRRTAYYTGLPPGDYTFQVSASNNDGLWNREGARLRFTLRPHFYQTKWFALLATAAVALLGGVFYRWRVGRLRQLAVTLTDQVALRTQDLETANETLQVEKARAETATAAKSQFLANMSHEIRTPLHGVIGMSQLVLANTLEPPQRSRVQTIRDSATALLEILNDVLDFSKIEAGKLDLECVELELRETLHDAAQLLAGQAHTKGIALRVEVDANVPAHVLGDPGRLRQVLLNLGGNAVKFTPQGGEVSISLQVLASDSSSALLRCTVRDSGIGIPAARVEQLFQPFTQIDASTTRHFGGTGLGLSIVRRLVDLMHGETGVESQEGVGSTFWFTARFGVSAAAGSSQSASRHEWSGRTYSGTVIHDEIPVSRSMARVVDADIGPLPGLGRVLIAEDHPVNQEVARTFAEMLGYQVDLVENGDEAVAASQRVAYDLILMDCQMPGMDGYQASREIRLRQSALGRRPPIVALTANAMRDEFEKCRAAGMDDLLAKPFTLEQLQSVLAQWLPQATRQPSSNTPSEPGVVDVPLDIADAINMKTLETLRNIGARAGMDLVTTVLRHFIAAADEDIGRVAQAVEERDAECLRRAAHGLASSTANVGAHTLASCYRQLEQLAREARLIESQTVFANLKREHERVVARVQQILGKAG